MFCGSFFPWVCSSPGLCGLIYLGASSAHDSPTCLANSFPGKNSLLFSPVKFWLRTGCLRVPARGIAQGCLVRIRRMHGSFRDSALCFGCRRLACIALEKLVLFLLAWGCGVCASQAAAQLPCPEPCLLAGCRASVGLGRDSGWVNPGAWRKMLCEGTFS